MVLDSRHPLGGTNQRIRGLLREASQELSVMRGMIGRKVGMTQVFDADGGRVAVTVVDITGNTVVTKKSTAGKDGYTAVKLGFEPAKKQEKNGDVRHRGINKAE